MIKICHNTYCLLAVLLLTAACHTTKKEKEQSHRYISVQNILKEEAAVFLKDTVVTSISLGVYDGGDMHTVHSGFLDVDKHNSPDDATIYEIASLTKTFTGALVAQAVLDGKITIDDDIREHLGSDFSNLAFQGNPIRVRHLLLHTSGLPQYLPQKISELMTSFTDDLPFQIEEVTASYTKTNFLEDVKNISLDTVPGTAYAYSNVGVELTAYILELVYQATFDDLVKTYITTPAEMNTTAVQLNEKQKKHLANGYGMNRRKTPHFPNLLWGADGGLKSTSPDLVMYMKFLLKTKPPLVEKSQEILYDGGTYKTGYFWPIRDTEENGIYYNHHGGAFGTQNWFYVFPKYDLGISIITNQSDLETAQKLEQTAFSILRRIKEINKPNTTPSQEKQASAPSLR